MSRIRIGNDFVVVWAITRSGIPEDLNNITESVLTLRTFSQQQEINFIILDNNKLKIEFDDSIITKIGEYNLRFNYIDEGREITIDVDCFNIVGRTDQADDITEIQLTGDVTIGFKGDPFTYYDFTEEQLLNIQQPILDLVDEVELEVSDWRLEEESRVTTENIRVASENDRIVNENTRVTYESNRNSAESSRVLNESERAAAELIREQVKEDTIIAKNATIQATIESIQTTQEANFVIAETNIKILEANDAISLANQKALEANNAAQAALLAIEQGEDTAAEWAIKEAERVANELIREGNEDDRREAEVIREQVKDATIIAKDEAIQATIDANNAAAYAGIQGDYANEKGNLADEQAEVARVAAVNANNKAALANTATTNANDAASLANSKAGIAQTAADNANAKAILADDAATNANTVATNVANAEAARVAAGSEVKTNKQNSLAVDGTGVKFPTVDAMNGEFDKISYIKNRLDNGFVKEVFISGSLVANKIYYVGVLARNNSTYKWSLAIYESNVDGSGSRTVSYLMSNPTEPTNPVTIPAYSSSGISALMLLDWTKVADGSNTAPNWKFNPNAYDLTKSATLYANSIAAINLETFNTKLNTSEYVADISLGKKIAYQHPRGDSEFVGNYFDKKDAMGVWFKPTFLTFNRIQILASTDSAPALVNIRIYKGTIAPSGYGSFNMSSLTLLHSTSQVWDTDNTKTRTIDLQTPITVEPTMRVFVMYSTLTEQKVNTRHWNENPNSDRNYYCFKISTDYSNGFSGTWNWANSPSYCQVDPIVSLVTPFALNSQLPIPRITIPSKIYAVVGTELNLYYDALVLGSDSGLNSPKEYKIEVISPVGKQKERCYSITPIAGDVGAKTLTIYVYDYNHSLLAIKTISLIIIAETAPSAVKNLVLIGDSLLGSNVISSTTQTKFNDLGSNVPIFRGFLGSSPANHQGIGGWTFPYFAGAGASYYKFTVSGITTIASEAVYSNNGSSFTIREVNVTGGVGYIKGDRKSGTNAPSSSGTLTKVSGTGDATISYSAVVLEAGNPLWNPSTSALDIAYYRSNLGMGVTKFDVMTLQLGINDSFGNSILSDSTITTKVINSIKAICTAFLADNSNTKIIIQLTTTDGNTLGGWGQNYAATASKTIYQKNIWRIRELILLEFDNAVYNANVEVGCAGLTIDRYYGYGLQDAAISSRVSTTEKVHVNALHPTTSGYQQIGDAYFAQILHLIQ